MAGRNHLQRIRHRGATWTIEGLGLVAVITAVGLLIAHPEPLELWALDFAVAIGFPGLLVLMGYWLGTDEIPPEDQWTVAYGAIGGFVFTGLLGIVVSSAQQFEGGIVFDTGYVLVTLATFGAFLGMTASVMAIGRRGVSPLQILGVTGSEERELLREIESDVPDEHVADWLSETVLERDDVLQLRILQYLRERETAVPYDAIVSELQTHETLRRDVDPAQLETELHHVHLPVLAASGLIAFDPEAHTARARET